MAMQHRDDMGSKLGYAFPFRYTQTEQYYKRRGEEISFLLDPSPADDRVKANATSDVLPRADIPDSISAHHKIVARRKMARLLAAYQEANLNDDLSVNEADRVRLLGLRNAAATYRAVEAPDKSVEATRHGNYKIMGEYAVPRAISDEVEPNAHMDDKTISDEAIFSMVDEK